MSNRFLVPIRVVPFSEAEFPQAPTSGPDLFTWRDFYGLRNALLRVLSKHGTVGPMGKLPMLETWELSEDAWEVATDKNPDFFVVDEMWNSWSRWNRVEASPHLVNRDLLTEMIAMLLDWPGWCVYMALGKGSLTVFSNRILYEGDLFQGCETLTDLSTHCGSAK